MVPPEDTKIEPPRESNSHNAIPLENQTRDEVTGPSETGKILEDIIGEPPAPAPAPAPHDLPNETDPLAPPDGVTINATSGLGLNEAGKGEDVSGLDNGEDEHYHQSDQGNEKDELEGEGEGEDEDEDEDEDGSEDDADANDSADESDIELVQNPSKNITVDLEEAFLKGFAFTGAFAYSGSFPEAPNPCLSLDGIGPIGLPLNAREASHIIGVSEQAPFGKNELTIIDKSVRDTWEISPINVRFENPKWGQWLGSSIIPAVCNALGVKTNTVRPVIELHKLLVYETGSHFLPHQDTEKSPGMFATIVIVLPSKYEGGALRLAHGKQTKIFDHAFSSNITTSVFAWYTDVYHSVQPIESGYRLALSYNLIQPPTSSVSRPVALHPDSAIDNLRRILLSWKQDTSGVSPEKIVWQLDHEYSQVSLSADGLKGRDAHLLAHLRPVAEELHFRIYLAQLAIAPKRAGGGGRL